ncbi:MAG: glutamate formimidoyltransferase [Thermoplasmataceae archaeon]|jgi:glutamate formiminotransferase
MQLVECVPNFSEGKNKEIVDEIVAAIRSIDGVKILDQEMDPDHNRSVVSFIAAPDQARRAAFEGIRTASKLIDMRKHHGEHPRFGASDVIPFIPISDVTMKDCIEISRKLGEQVGVELNIPVYMYGNSALLESRKNLEDIRNKNFQFEELSKSIGEAKWKPDYGPSAVGSAGASIIGSREALIAYNVNLNTTNLEIGKKIARALRAKDGGLTFVKSLAFFIKEKNMVQISMNLTNFSKTPVYRAFELVRLEALRYGVTVAESEVVGLIPMEAIVEASRYYLQLNSFKSNQILEVRMME